MTVKVPVEVQKYLDKNKVKEILDAVSGTGNNHELRDARHSVEDTEALDEYLTDWAFERASFAQMDDFLARGNVDDEKYFRTMARAGTPVQMRKSLRRALADIDLVSEETGAVWAFVMEAKNRNPEYALSVMCTIFEVFDLSRRSKDEQAAFRLLIEKATKAL